MDEKVLNRLEQHLKMVTDGLTREDFTAAFQEVVKVVLNIGEALGKENIKMRNDFTILQNLLKDDNKADLDEVKTAARIAVGAALTSMTSSINTRLAAMEATIADVEDGKDADEIMILERLKAMIPTMEEIGQQIPQFGPGIRDALELLRGDDRLDISAIRGIDALKEEFRGWITKIGTGARTVAGRIGFYLYVGGVKKGIVNTIDFVGSSGVGIVFSKVNGRETLTFSSTGGGTGSGGASALMFVVPTEIVDGNNKIFTVPGQLVIAGSDNGNDSSAVGVYNAVTNITTITYSVAPQNNVFAFVISSTNPTLKIAPDISGAVDNSNITFSVAGRVQLVFIDRVVDNSAILSYNPFTNITTITASVPPQNDVSALVVVGFPITTQIPSGSIGANNMAFSAVGQINAAIVDSNIDENAILAYNCGTNMTLITYSVPPQFNVSTF